MNTVVQDDNAQKEIKECGASTEYIKRSLKETPSYVVLFDEDCDLVIACNINFNRDLLKQAKKDGKLIATDVHVLGDIYDAYNRDFMQYANILFLSDENIKGDYREFLMEIEKEYQNEIIVLGMGEKGALMYVKEEDKFYELPAVSVGEVVNTVGAGDALFSGFLHYYVKGETPVEALQKAQIFASYKIGFDGGANGFADEGKIEVLQNGLRML